MKRDARENDTRDNHEAVTDRQREKETYKLAGSTLRKKT